MAANSSSEIKAADIIPYCDDELKPFVGRTYESIKDFEESYKNYAHTVGFSVRSWTATKDKNHVLKYKYFVCSKEGFNKKKQHMQSEDKGKKISRKRSNTREGCNATACVRRTEEGNYMVITFIEGHSHELCTPRKKQFLRSNRKICDAQKNLLSSLDRVNIGVSKAYHFIKDQVGGYENVGFTIKDAQNYSRDLKTLIKDTDAHMFIDSLKRQQESDPSFYFVYELDADDHLKQVFWADGIARKNYAVFGDLISFDSTYNTNKYSMIFAPFTGINHHRLSITLGAAFLANEKTESFIWLFDKFIECMGHEPHLIVTDQDPAMKSAISQVFPHSKHRFCMWHIMKKLSEKVGGVLNANIEFQTRFKDCVWNSETIADFESSWASILFDFKLSNNDWLVHMFELRTMWIPTYFRDIPLSGLLRTTSRSESENAFFNNFVNNKLGLVEFYARFESAINSQRQKELKADYDTLTGKPKLKTNLKLEKHACDIYTHKNFYIFQEELWASCMGCGVKSSKAVSDDAESFISTIVESTKSSFNCKDVFYSSSKITCSCGLLETQGIPCRHIILVLKGQAMSELPSICILNRWTKAATCHMINEIDRESLADISKSERRRKLISNAWTELTSCIDIAKENDDTLVDLISYASSWKKQQVAKVSNDGVPSTMKAYYESIIPKDIEILPPVIANTKGSGKRFKDSRELAIQFQQKNPRVCRTCGAYTLHDSRNCPKRTRS